MDRYVISLVLLALQVSPHTTQTEAGYHCPKLYYHSKDADECLPCTLCSTSLPSIRYRSECKEKNEKTFSHHKGQNFWCDDPRGKLPECPPLHDSVLMGKCSKTCQDGGRQFAPDCICRVGCFGQPSHTVSCTHHLQWNTTFVPENCTKSADHPSLRTESKSAFTPLTITLFIFGVLLFIAALIGLVVFLIRSKSCKKESASPSSSDAGNPFIKDKQSELDMKVEEKSISGGSETKPMMDVDLEAPEAVEVHLPNIEVQTETCDMQTRTAPPQTADPLNGVDTESWWALDALLKSRKDVEEFIMMMDQEYRFGKGTWHSVAVKLLQWDTDKVTNLEYRIKPCMNENPRDGFMWKVLKEAHEKAYGLLDLLTCLESLEFRHKEAEQFLKDFMAKIKCQNQND